MPDSTRQPEDPIDAALLERIRATPAGRPCDPAVWRELLQRHQQALLAICIRMAGSTGRRDPGGADPTDLCQEAMVRIVQGLPSFDGQSRLTTWMTRIAMNVCLSHLRATKLRQHGSLDATRPGEGREGSSGFDRYSDLGDRKGEPAPSSGVQTEEQRRAFAAAWSRLDPDQRAILVLRDVRDLDYEQIASVLGLAVGTVKSRIFRARQALREQIEGGRRGRHGDLQGADSEPFQ